MSYNRSYHRFFEGYTEKRVLDPMTGKMHIERVYVGDYYRHKLDDMQWKRLKATYILLYAWALLCLLLQGISASTNEWYCVLPVLAGILAMVWLGFYVCLYVAGRRELNIRQYRDREMLKTTAMGSAIAFGLAFAGQAAWMVVFRSVYPYGIACLAADLSAVLALYYMFYTERNMDYVKYKNEKKADPDSYDIRIRQDDV